MSTSSPDRTCPYCGSDLPVDVPESLCPRCLMAQIIQPTQAGDNEPPIPVLTPEELAPHFPQLDILECLGRGGMGVVYKARQKSLNRLVALKLLAPERADDPQFAARFEKEAHALALLNHPNIVGVHDFGQAGEFYYLLMEFVDGVNLRQLLETKRLTPKEALSIVPPVCEALQCAHDHGIVHRDIKPENLLIDKAGSVKIADFGIAKIYSSPLAPREEPCATASTHDQRTAQTALSGGSYPHISRSEMATLGTPDYAAPEQANGTADHRADIYSLGVVLYEMLTGERPKENLTPPSKRVQVDVRIDEIVLKALDKAPELRFATAAEFRTQVEAAANLKPSGHKAPMWTWEVPLFAPWNRTIKSSLVAALALAGIGGIGSLLYGFCLPGSIGQFAAPVGGLVIGWIACLFADRAWLIPPSQSTSWTPWLRSFFAVVGAVFVVMVGALSIQEMRGNRTLAAFLVTLGASAFPAAVWWMFRTRRRGRVGTALAAAMLVTVLSVGFVMRQELSHGIRKQGLKEIAQASRLYQQEYHRWPTVVNDLLMQGNPRGIRFLAASGPGEALVAPASGLRYEPPVDQGMGFAGIPGEPGCFFDEKTVVGETEAIARLRLQLDDAYQPNNASHPSVIPIRRRIEAAQAGLFRGTTHATTAATTTPQAIPSARVLPPADEPHPRLQLELLAWLDEVQAGGDWSGWRWNGSVASPKDFTLPDGLPVPATAKDTGTGASAEKPRFLCLWFSHPSFDALSVGNVTLLDDKDQPLKKPSDDFATMFTPKSDKLKTGWLTHVLCAGRVGDPDRIARLRLDYSQGAWKPHGDLAADFQGRMALSNGVHVTATGQAVDGQAFVELTRDRSLDTGITQFDFLAITRDGRTLTRVGLVKSGTQMLPTERLHFDTPLSQVKSFQIRKRPILTMFWNIPLNTASRSSAAASVLQMRWVSESPSAATEAMVLEGSASKGGDPQTLHIDKTILMTHEDVQMVGVVGGEGGQKGYCGISITFTSSGSERLTKITSEGRGRRLAIIIDGRLYAAPLIQEPITGGKVEVSGNFSEEEAKSLVEKIRACLPMPEKASAFPQGTDASQMIPKVALNHPMKTNVTRIKATSDEFIAAAKKAFPDPKYQPLSGDPTVMLKQVPVKPAALIAGVMAEPDGSALLPALGTRAQSVEMRDEGFTAVKFHAKAGGQIDLACSRSGIHFTVPVWERQSALIMLQCVDVKVDKFQDSVGGIAKIVA